MRTAKQPALLIEAGVAVNTKDELNVASKEGRGRIADVLTTALKDCLTDITQKR